MPENPPAPMPENSTISSMREHISRLETQLSQANITGNTTKAEMEALVAQKSQLETQVAEKVRIEEELNATKTRQTELETRIAGMVEKELATFPADKLEAVKGMIAGLTPDAQLDKLANLKELVGVTHSPPPGNPPSPPVNPPQDDKGKPPVDDSLNGPTPFQKNMEAVRKGANPLDLIEFSKPAPKT